MPVVFSNIDFGKSSFYRDNEVEMPWNGSEANRSYKLEIASLEIDCERDHWNRLSSSKDLRPPGQMSHIRGLMSL